MTESQNVTKSFLNINVFYGVLLFLIVGYSLPFIMAAPWMLSFIIIGINLAFSLIIIYRSEIRKYFDDMRGLSIWDTWDGYDRSGRNWVRVVVGIRLAEVFYSAISIDTSTWIVSMQDNFVAEYFMFFIAANIIMVALEWFIGVLRVAPSEVNLMDAFKQKYEDQIDELIDQRKKTNALLQTANKTIRTLENRVHKLEDEANDFQKIQTELKVSEAELKQSLMNKERSLTESESLLMDLKASLLELEAQKAELETASNAPNELCAELEQQVLKLESNAKQLGRKLEAHRKVAEELAGAGMFKLGGKPAVYSPEDVAIIRAGSNAVRRLKSKGGEVLWEKKS